MRGALLLLAQELGAAPASPASETDEASLLHLSAALVRGAERAQPAWLQTARARLWLAQASRGLSALNLVLLVLIALALLLIGLYAYSALRLGRDEEPLGESLKEPLREPLREPGPGRAAGAPPSEESPRRSPRWSLGSPPAAKSRAGSRVGSGQRTPQTQASTLAVPSLRGAPLEQLKKSDYQVTDLQGKKLLHVDVMRPPRAEDAEAFAPEEYVTLYSANQNEELAMCALGPAPGGSWECHVYVGEGELLGFVSEERGFGESSFALLCHSGGEALLRLRGRPEERRLQVLDQGGAVVAAVEPGPLALGRPGEYYQATFYPDADMGLVVLALLAVDRLLSQA